MPCLLAYPVGNDWQVQQWVENPKLPLPGKCSYINIAKSKMQKGRKADRRSGICDNTVNPEFGFSGTKWDWPWARRRSQQLVVELESNHRWLERLQEVVGRDLECGSPFISVEQKEAFLETPVRKEGKLVAPQPLWAGVFSPWLSDSWVLLKNRRIEI